MILVPLLAATLAVAPGCDVTDATLEWGFKESFRAYIDGSIANGEWTTDGVDYATPTFTWTGGEGRYDPATAEGIVRFDGSVRFVGHDGVLDTTIANPVVRFDGEGAAVLLLDVSGPTMAGDPIDATAVEFVELGDVSVGAAEAMMTVHADTVLTEDGATAFPNYAAGEAFDPVALDLPVADSCEVVTFGGSSAPLQSGPQWPWLIGGIAIIALPVLAIAGVVIAVVLARRRRRA